MDKNTHTLLMGGKNEVLKFNIGTLRRIKQITGKDPLAIIATGIDAVDTVDFAEAIIKGSITKNGNTDEDITKMFEELPIPMITEIINAFTKAFIIEAAGESGADTQQGQAS